MPKRPQEKVAQPAAGTRLASAEAEGDLIPRVLGGVLAVDIWRLDSRLIKFRAGEKRAVVSAAGDQDLAAGQQRSRVVVARSVKAAGEHPIL